MIDQTQLAESLGQLDPGTRALLDLSLRRAIPDDQVAKVLGVDPASIPPRRARGIAQLADLMEVPGPAELAALLIAIPELPEHAWGVPAAAPFAGRVSPARRAKALRRVAVAASPLVAVGAVMAAVVVASSSDGSGSRSGSGSAGAGSRAAVTAPAPEARHGLPPGVQLAHARRPAHKAAHHRARRAHHHASGAGEPAILAREPRDTAEHSVPVAYYPPAAQQPRNETHHHHTHTQPKASPQPSPAPVQTPSTPSQPVSTPAPTQPSSPAVQVSPPQQTTTVHSSPWPESGKGHKTAPSQPNLDPPSGVTQQHGSYHHGSGSSSGGSGCGHHGGSYSHGDSDHASSGGRSWHPPGLFRKRH